MINIENEPLRNARNGTSVSMRIKAYFRKYPNSTVVECCRILGLDYRRYGGRARKIKHDLKHWTQSIAPVTDQYGRPLKPLVSVHRQEYRFEQPVPVGYVAILREKAQSCRVKEAWYRSSNRNRQLEYFDDYVSIRVYPKSGTCRILPRRSLAFDDLRVCVGDVFAKILPSQAILSDSFRCMMNSLQLARLHRAFYVGPIAPFRIACYRHSHGLDIRADASHPEHLEIHEDWPTWLSPLLESQRNQNQVITENTKIVGNFASEIQNHLHVMKGIGLAVDRLDEATRNLTETIGGKSGNENKKNRLSSATRHSGGDGSC